MIPSARLVVGLQPVREAIRVHGARLESVALETRENPRLEALARYARDQGVKRIERVLRSALDRASAGVSHQGAAAWAPPLELTPFESLLADPELLALALDGIQDPQNFGAAIRAAVAVANAAVVWPEHASAPLSLATFRASAGAIEHARLCRVASLAGALAEAVVRGVAVVGLDAQAASRLDALQLTGPTMLVIGSEHEGMSRSVRRACSAFAKLAMIGPLGSLNASAAAACALQIAVINRSKSK